ncbi:MAG TPA: ABC transporter permease [Magnetospirillaceae bacterium]
MTSANKLSAPPSPARIVAWLASARAWLFLIVLMIFFEGFAQLRLGTTFLFNPFNLQSIAVFTVQPLLLALGQTFVIISGGIDLSVGFTMGFAAVIVSHMVNLLDPEVGPWLSLVIGVIVALVGTAVPGLINGLLIARLRIPPFIGTLGMYGVARGVAFLLAGGTTIPVNNAPLAYFGTGVIAGIPVIVIVALVILLALHYMLSHTRFGQYTYALGGSRPAAVRAGIDVRKLTVWLYVLSAVCAGLSGILYTGRFLAGAAQAGEPLLLDSIAAVVIGGASLFGGSGSLIGTLIGALIIALIQYGLVFVNVEPFWQFVAVGVVIIISVLVDQSQKRIGGVRQDE